MKHLVLSLLLLITFCSKAQRTEKYLIFFALNSYALDLPGKASLDSLAENLRYRQYSITIIGHTDSLGSGRSNMKLSKERSETVLRYLSLNGVDSSKIADRYYGESRPVFDISSGTENEKNRCVEVIINYPKPVAADPHSIEELPERLRFERDTTILCKDGAQIIISSGAFYPHKISEVNLNIREEYSLCDILNNTTSVVADDGTCLSSAGMIYVRPTLKGVEIQPNKGELVTIKVPLKGGKPDPQMKLYFEQQDSCGNKTWKAQESELGYENAGTQYYVFRVDTLMGFNLDKSMGITCMKNGPRIRVHKYRDVKVYQTYPGELYLSRGAKDGKGKYYTIDSVIPSKNPMLTVVAYTRKGVPLVAQGPLLNLEYDAKRKFYVLRPEYFHLMRRSGTPYQNGKDDLCRYFEN